VQRAARDASTSDPLPPVNREDAKGAKGREPNLKLELLQDSLQLVVLIWPRKSPKPDDDSVKLNELSDWLRVLGGSF
jgi:hypothetical protein